ncbi:SCO3374 family protein [Streptomyces sp. NPDC056373]|uniref:SCO3374 family protein n=1 Tax=Streptomyces sp. NPDC056373 TaxID=3345798 RepID=UPI0035E1B7FB
MIASPALPSPAFPLPRRPLDPAGPAVSGPGTDRPASGQVRRWYEKELGWPTVPGDPPRLVVGVRYDVLDVPARAGHATLRRRATGSPVALHGDRMLFLVAAGSAEELPGLLEWLDWGRLPLDLAAIGAGGLMAAPSPRVSHGERAGLLSCEPSEPSEAREPWVPSEAREPWEPSEGCEARGASEGHEACGVSEPSGPRDPCEPRAVPAVALPACGAGTPFRGGSPPSGPGSAVGRPSAPGRVGSQGAAVWLRPPEPGCEVEASLPTLSALGGAGDAPDLVRLVNAVATQCHRVRLRRACAQPPAVRTQGR